MTDTTPTLAELLRTARQQQGYSREQLASATKVPRAFIVAVEEEDDTALPDVVFGRGFVRILGKHLGLEVAPLLVAYDALNRATTTHTVPLHVGLALDRGEIRKPTTRGRRGVLLVLVLVLLGGGVFYWWLSPAPKVSTPQSPAAEVASQPVQVEVLESSAPTPVAAALGQRLRLQVVRPLRVAVALDDAPRREQLFLPQSYEFAFARQAWLRVSDTAAVKIWFNGEDLGDLQRGGRQRTLIFTADPLDTARAAENADRQL